METLANNGTWTVRKEKMWRYRKQKGWKETGPSRNASGTMLRTSLSLASFSSRFPPSTSFPLLPHHTPASLPLLQGFPFPSFSFLFQPCSMSALICGYSHQVRASCRWQEPNSNRLKPEWSSFRSSWIQVLYNGIGNSFSPYLDSDFLSWPHLQWVWRPPAAPNLDIPLACYQPILQANIFLAWQISLLMVLWSFQGEVQWPSLDDTSVPEPVTLTRIH